MHKETRLDAVISLTEANRSVLGDNNRGYIAVLLVVAEDLGRDVLLTLL